MTGKPFEPIKDQMVRIKKHLGERTTQFVQQFTNAIGNEIITGGRYGPGSPIGDPGLWEVNQGKKSSEHRKPAEYHPGFFRANWAVNIGSIGESKAGKPGDPNLAFSGTQLVTAVADVKPGDSVYFTNDAPYANRLEYSGHSQQAPAGIMRPVVDNADLIAEEVLRHIGVE